jgi:hypothetical protein
MEEATDRLTARTCSGRAASTVGAEMVARSGGPGQAEGGGGEWPRRQRTTIKKSSRCLWSNALSGAEEKKYKIRKREIYKKDLNFRYVSL